MKNHSMNADSESYCSGGSLPLFIDILPAEDDIWWILLKPYVQYLRMLTRGASVVPHLGTVAADNIPGRWVTNLSMARMKNLSHASFPE